MAVNYATAVKSPVQKPATNAWGSASQMPAPAPAGPAPAPLPGYKPTAAPMPLPTYKPVAPAPAPLPTMKPSAPTTGGIDPAPRLPGSPGPGWVKTAAGGWVPPNHPLAKTALPTSPVPGQPTTPAAALGTDVMAKVRQLMNQDPTKVSLDDPGIRTQLNSFATLKDRLRQRSQEDAAEALGAQGMNSSGAMDTERRALNEGYSDDVGGYAAQLQGNEISARRQEVMQALEQGAGLMTAEQERALRLELAKLDDATRRFGITTEAGTQAAAQRLQDKLGTGDLRARLLGMMLNNEQFNNDLGFRIGAKQADLNAGAFGAFA